MAHARKSLLLITCTAVFGSNLYGAAPTIVRGTNEQRVEVEAPIINLGIATSGAATAQVSVGSLHEGTTVNSSNSQTVFLGAGEAGEFAIMNIGIGAGGEGVCANTMIGSVGSSSCMK